MASDPMTACQKSNVRSKVAAITDRDCPISVNGKATSDPTIAADTERTRVIERTDDLRILSDLITDGTQQPSLDRKKPCPIQDMVDRVEDDPFPE